MSENAWVTRILGVTSEDDAMSYIAQNKDSIVVFDRKTGKFSDQIFGVPLRHPDEVIGDLISGKLSDQ